MGRTGWKAAGITCQGERTGINCRGARIEIACQGDRTRPLPVAGQGPVLI